MVTRRAFIGVVASAAGLARWHRALAALRLGRWGNRTTNPYFRTDPMVGRVTESGAVVHLVTSDTLSAPIRVRVRWSESPDDLEDSPNVSSEAVGQTQSDSIELAITGLGPDRKYYYLVQYEEPSNPDVWVNLPFVGEFRVQRPAGSEFDFCVIADAHWGRPDFNYSLDGAWGFNCSACLSHMLSERDSDFCVELGDGAYLVEVQSQEDAYDRYDGYRRVMSTILQKMPLYMVLGNHEQEAGFFQQEDPTIQPLTMSRSAPAQYLQKWGTRARLTFIPNPKGNTYPEGGEGPPRYDSSVDWGAGSDPWNDGDRSYLQNFYAWTWGDALFIVLDPYRYTLVGETRVPTSPSEWRLGPTQWQFLEDVLSASTARWKFILCHHQVGGGLIDVNGWLINEGQGEAYGRGSAIEATRPGTEQARLHELMKCHGVQFFVYGHDHAFCHSVLDGVNYLLCGRPSFLNTWFNKPGMRSSYGDVLVQGRDKPWTRALYTVLGYARFRVSPERVTMEWVRTGYSFAQNATPNFAINTPPRDWRESWFGRTYPVTSPDVVTVERNPTDVDGVRTVAGATIASLYEVPAGPDYYVQPIPTRPESFQLPVIPLAGFPADLESVAVVDCVPEVIYRKEWVWGDLNDDGKVDGEDIQAYVNSVVPQSPDACLSPSNPQQLVNRLLGA